MGIAILINLSIRTAQNAKDRDKNPVSSIIYTISLWLVFGFIGIMLSSMILSVFYKEGFSFLANLLWIIFVYAFYLGFALLGGFIANKISKRTIKFRTTHIAIQKEYLDHFNDDEKLKKPCKISIIRDKDMFTMFDQYSFTLNKKDLGYVKQEQGILISTTKRKNTVKAWRQRGSVCFKPYQFIAPDGGEVEIHFFDKEFDNSKTKILRGHLPIIEKK